MTYYKLLTPTLRKKILESADNGLRELSECRETAYVGAYRTGYQALKTIIKGLPDGYLLPFTKEDESWVR